jgi:hypothetical protein
MIYLEKLEEAKKKKRGRCWTGYKPKPGSVPYSKGSCVKEGYQQIGDILAEAILGKIRTKAADKLDKFSRDQYRKGEVDDASGKPKRARLRGLAAHVAGKVAQRVRPMKEGYQQIGHLIAEVVSKAVLSSPETVKRRLDRRRSVVKGRMAIARKDPLSPRGTNSRRGGKSEDREVADQITTADVWRSEEYKKKYPKK